MPRLATTATAAILQAANRPGDATRALDAAEQARVVLGDVMNALGTDRRKSNKGLTGPRGEKPPIASLRSALKLWVTEQHDDQTTDKISQNKAAEKFGVSKSAMHRMAKKLKKGSLEYQLEQIANLVWPRSGPLGGNQNLAILACVWPPES